MRGSTSTLAPLALTARRRGQAGQQPPAQVGDRDRGPHAFGPSRRRPGADGTEAGGVVRRRQEASAVVHVQHPEPQRQRALRLDAEQHPVGRRWRHLRALRRNDLVRVRGREQKAELRQRDKHGHQSGERSPAARQASKLEAARALGVAADGHGQARGQQHQRPSHRHDGGAARLHQHAGEHSNRAEQGRHAARWRRRGQARSTPTPAAPAPRRAGSAIPDRRGSAAGRCRRCATPRARARPHPAPGA